MSLIKIARLSSWRLGIVTCVLSVFTLSACSTIGDRHPDSVAPQSELSQFLSQYGAKTAIVKPGKGALKYDYIVPAGPYDQLFDWDMYFMGVALSYDKIGEPVETSVKDFLLYVDEQANDPGYAPRELSVKGPWALPEQCKPFMAQAAIRASVTMGKFDWINEPSPDSEEHTTYYNKLKMMLGFWEANRKAADGLFFWYNGVESGADNNPAVSVDPALTTEGVDLQVYLYREYLSIVVIAQKLNHPEDVSVYQKKAEDLRVNMIKRMWSIQDNIFYNIDSRTGQQIKIKTWTNLTPLWAKMIPQDFADRMIKTHLLSTDEFWATHGVRSLSKTEALYDPAGGYWQGPVWVISNYLMMHGLLNYGYAKEAIELANKTVDFLVADYKETKGMNECYDPDTGAPTADGNFVSWNLLAEHMLEEAQSGYDPTALDAK